jgi:hypothetical protein
MQLLQGGATWYSGYSHSDTSRMTVIQLGFGAGKDTLQQQVRFKQVKKESMPCQAWGSTGRSLSCTTPDLFDASDHIVHS